MDVLDAIYTRRSIRKFTDQDIDKEILRSILRAGFYAPSAKNQQPWHFIIIKSKEMLLNISQKHPYAKMLPNAACCIVVCGDKNKQGQTGFLVEDCSAAIENMLLAAHGLGLGAVWLSLYPISSRSKPIGQLLDIPKNIIPVGMIAVGYKAEERTTKERFNEDRLHFEKW